jgi:hypothetical protein
MADSEFAAGGKTVTATENISGERRMLSSGHRLSVVRYVEILE